MRTSILTRSLVTAVVALSGASLVAGQATQTPLKPPATVHRTGHTATVLSDGRALLAGGRVEREGKWYWIAPAALFDPSTARLVATGELVGLREEHQATRLADGNVLLTGGMGPAPGNDDTLVPLASAEIYDVATGKFRATGAMTRPRSGHTTDLLPNGHVRISGGEVPVVKTPTVEEYDPKTQKFTAVAR